MLKITKQSITLTKGDDASIQLIPRYKDKTAYVFLEGDRGVFRLKTGNTLIEKECDIYQDPNKMVVSFQPADTINLKPGIYRYEVELITIYGFHYTFIADQTFIIGNEYEQRLQASGSNGSGNAGSNLPEIDGELTEDPVVSGEIQPTNPSVDYNNLTNKPKLNGVQIAGNHDNAYYGIPTELADLTADADHRTVSDTEKETWNAKSDFSGSYNDLTDVPEDLVEDAEYVHTDNNYTGAEKTKLGDIESGAEVNVQADWNETDTSSDAYIQNKPTIPAAQVNSDWNASSGVAEILHKPTLGTAAAKDYTGSVLENSTDLVESGAVKTAIDNAISSVYKPAGNKACAELVSALLVASNLGNVYNMTDDGVTTADFVEGAGKAIEAGDNVVIVDIGSSVYKFDLLSGMVDLSNYVQKSSTSGLIKNDGTIDQTAYAKQNEMSVSTSGDQATIQLKNGTTATVLTQHQDISGKVDKEQGKGLSTNDYTTVEMEKLAAISTEANKVTASETNGNIQIDGTETTVYDDTELQGAVSDLEDDVEEIQGELTTELATVEGNPLNFSTKSAQNAKSTILSLEPIQDLHGYDKPWVGGADVNLFRPGEAKTFTDSGITFTSDGNGRYTVKGTCTNDVYGTFDCEEYSFPDGSTHTLGFMNSQASPGGQGIDFCFYNGSTQQDFWGLNVVNRYYHGYSALSNKTVNKYSIYVKAGITVDMTLSPFVVEGSSPMTNFRPYRNICPISGRTEIGILGVGKNLLPMTLAILKALNYNGTWNNNVYTYHNVAYTIQQDADGNIIGIDAHGQANADSTIILADNEDFLIEGTSYILNGCPIGGSDSTYRIQYSNNINSSVEDYGNGASFTEWNHTTYPHRSVRLRVFNGYNANHLKFYPMIRLSMETDATFEPYTKSTDLTISLGQTVYGGTLDVENGVLVVDRAKRTVNGSESGWGLSVQSGNNPRRFVLNISTLNWGVEQSDNSISDKFVYKPIQATTDTFGTFRLSNVYLVLPDADSRFADENELKTWLNNNNSDFCYELATPITINLTPHTINLLKGVNNISTDGDKITLTYRDGSVATLGDLTSAVDNLDSKIDESKILTDTVTGDKYILVVTNGVLSVEQVSN